MKITPRVQERIVKAAPGGAGLRRDRSLFLDTTQLNDTRENRPATRRQRMAELREYGSVDAARSEKKARRTTLPDDTPRAHHAWIVPTEWPIQPVKESLAKSGRASSGCKCAHRS